MQNQFHLYIVDDHQIIVDGIRSLLSDECKISIVGFSNNPLKVIGELQSIKVDVLLTDVNMPYMSGVELSRAIKKQYPLIKIICLSMYGDREAVTEMISAGVSGYVLKNTGKEELMEAIERVANGKTYYSEEVMQELIKPKITDSVACRLTNREIELIRFIEKEYSNKQIAQHLFISERTVETHRKNIFRKTQTQSIVGLIKYAYEHKII